MPNVFKKYRKNEIADYQWRQLLADLIENKYSEHDVIYTDGSKMEERVGCAFYHQLYQWKSRLPDKEVILTAELVAIREAVKFANGDKAKKYLIMSDSLSSISIIRKKYTKNPIVLEIKEMMGHNMTIEWMPSHIGNKGNNAADSLAKEGGRLTEIVEIPCSLDACHRILTEVYHKKWQEEWDRNKWGLHIIKPKLGPLKFEGLNRREQIVLSRLRLGVCRFTHSHYFSNGAIRKCLPCNSTLTIGHVLMDCPQFTNPRRLLRQICTQGNLCFNPINVLNGNVPFTEIVRFLKEIKLYGEI